jgi:5-carboxymethyl-2-hydroxymuconate isomerase
VIEHFGAFATAGERDRAMEVALSVCSSSGIMSCDDVKIRCIGSEAILFGDGRRSFIHITLSMLAGRTAQQKIGLSEALRDSFRRHHPAVASISVDIRDMDPGPYRKSLA